MLPLLQTLLFGACVLLTVGAVRAQKYARRCSGPEAGPPVKLQAMRVVRNDTYARVLSGHDTGDYAGVAWAMSGFLEDSPNANETFPFVMRFDVLADSNWGPYSSCIRGVCFHSKDFDLPNVVGRKSPTSGTYMHPFKYNQCVPNLNTVRNPCAHP